MNLIKLLAVDTTKYWEVIMNKAYYLTTLLFPVLALAQNSDSSTYPIEKFSDIYSGEVTVIKQGDNNEYTLTIVNEDNQPVIKLSPYAGFSEFDLNDKGKIKSNIYNPPYDEQSLIVSQDVNFDGVADLVIRSDLNSCYGGPSYDIYLQQGEELVHSPEFSTLAQEYCVMFRINNETKTLYTVTKSATGGHRTTDYKIENGKPVLVKIVETKAPFSITQYKEQNPINGKMVEKAYQKIAVLLGVEKKEPKFGFVMDSPESVGKANVMFLLQGHDEKLHFVLTDWHGVIKQHYDGDFIYEAIISRLTFAVGQDTYIISDNDMKVITPEKTMIRTANDMATFNRLEMATKEAKNVTVREVPLKYQQVPTGKDLSTDTVYSLVLENGKKMKLLKENKDKNADLHFVLTDKDDKIELHYNDRFSYRKLPKKLIFLLDDDVAYIVSPDTLAIVMPDETVTVLKVVPNSATGEISKVTDFQNVFIMREPPIRVHPLPEDKTIKQQKK